MLELNTYIMRNLFNIVLLFAITTISFSQEAGCKSGNCADGKGKYIYTNGFVYEGQFVNGMRDGLGILTEPNGNAYDGMWKADEMNGQGKYTWADGSSYSGEWKNGIRDGYGIFFFNNGDKYTGYFVNNQFHGKGKYTWADGSSQEGMFAEGQMVNK